MLSGISTMSYATPLDKIRAHRYDGLIPLPIPYMIDLPDVVATCTALGGIVAVTLSSLKTIGLVQRHPKVFALALASIATVLHARITGADVGVSWELGHCVAETLAGAIATHEIALKRVERAVGWAAAEGVE